MRANDRSFAAGQLSRFLTTLLLAVTFALAWSGLTNAFYRNVGLIAWAKSEMRGTPPDAAIALLERAKASDSRDWALGNAHWLGGDEHEARKAWTRRGLEESAAQMVRVAASGRLVSHADEGERWLTRAESMGVCQTDLWTERAIQTELREDVANARAYYDRAASFDASCGVHGRADALYRSGQLLRSKTEPPDRRAALIYYRRAIAAGDFTDGLAEADCHYQMGQLLFSAGPQNDDEAVLAFERALAVRPDHSWANLLMGRAVYRRDHDFARARTYLLRALEVRATPDWRFPFALGELHEAEGYEEEAVLFYRQALMLSPGDTRIISRLERLGVEP